MAEKPPLPKDIEAVLDRCVGEMRERIVSELRVAETEAEKLEILARFSREIGDVRGKVAGRAGMSIGQRWALIGAGLAVFGAGVATASLWPRSQDVTATAVEAPKGDAMGGAAPGEDDDTVTSERAEAKEADYKEIEPSKGAEENNNNGTISGATEKTPDIKWEQYGASGARHESATADKERADRASAGTSEAISEGIERLKRDYLDALRRSTDEALSEDERRYATDDAAEFAASLRKHGIESKSLVNQPRLDAKESINPIPHQGASRGRDLLPEK